ncbi:MAG: biotin/lipoyl-binding protein [Anaerolineae bacterium]|nr:biotin/lipoyl-binding protein [Anaerolineae bacterium]
MTQFQLRIGEEQREFDVIRQGDELHVRDGERAADVALLHRDGDELLIEIRRPDGTRRRLRLVGTRQRDTRHLWIDGRAVTAERVRRATSSRSESAGSLAASIPAVVSQLLVAVGDVVQPGDKLILLESMKMVIPILAPRGGRITQIHCAPGDSVPAGVALLEIEDE